MQHIWIFQLATAPSESSKVGLLQQLNAFVAVWKSHGSPVPGAVDLHYDRFVVVKAEPGHASGCSIDSMNKGVTEILSNHGLQVLGPEFVHFKEADGAIVCIDFKEAKAALLSGRIHAETIVFDSTLGNKNDLEGWEVPLKDTWLKRFIPQTHQA